MADHPKIERHRLREIGWKEWDPIGLAGCPDDEYDAYLIQAASRLLRGDSVQQVADYLDRIACDHMGLGPSTPAGRDAAARTATLIKDYLESASPDPPKVS